MNLYESMNRGFEKRYGFNLNESDTDIQFKNLNDPLIKKYLNYFIKYFKESYNQNDKNLQDSEIDEIIEEWWEYFDNYIPLPTSTKFASDPENYNPDEEIAFINYLNKNGFEDNLKLWLKAWSNGDIGTSRLSYSLTPEEKSILDKEKISKKADARIKAINNRLYDLNNLIKKYEREYRFSQEPINGTFNGGFHPKAMNINKYSELKNQAIEEFKNYINSLNDSKVMVLSNDDLKVVTPIRMGDIINNYNKVKSNTFKIISFDWLDPKYYTERHYKDEVGKAQFYPIRWWDFSFKNTKSSTQVAVKVFEDKIKEMKKEVEDLQKEKENLQNLPKNESYIKSRLNNSLNESLNEVSSNQKILAIDHSAAQDGRLDLVIGNDILEEVEQSYDYYTDITNESGILFGYFNDEDVTCYSTGYSTLESLKQAIINKDYMIEIFEDDDWVEEAETGEELWNGLVDAIQNSYVDRDSSSAMFLMDSRSDKLLMQGDMYLNKRKIEKFNEAKALKALENMFKKELNKDYYTTFIRSNLAIKENSIENILTNMLGDYLNPDDSEYSANFVHNMLRLADLYPTAKDLPNYNILLGYLNDYLDNHPELKDKQSIINIFKNDFIPNIITDKATIGSDYYDPLKIYIYYKDPSGSGTDFFTLDLTKPLDSDYNVYQLLYNYYLFRPLPKEKELEKLIPKNSELFKLAKSTIINKIIPMVRQIALNNPEELDEMGYYKEYKDKVDKIFNINTSRNESYRKSKINNKLNESLNEKDIKDALQGAPYRYVTWDLNATTPYIKFNFLKTGRGSNGGFSNRVIKEIILTLQPFIEERFNELGYTVSEIHTTQNQSRGASIPVFDVREGKETSITMNVYAPYDVFSMGIIFDLKPINNNEGENKGKPYISLKEIKNIIISIFQDFGYNFQHYTNKSNYIDFYGELKLDTFNKYQDDLEDIKEIDLTYHKNNSYFNIYHNDWHEKPLPNIFKKILERLNSEFNNLGISTELRPVKYGKEDFNLYINSMIL